MHVQFQSSKVLKARLCFLILAFGMMMLANKPVLAVRVASFQITAPEQVELGQPITLRLAVTDGQDIAGYESHVLFDTEAAHFNSLRQRDNDLRQLGRDILPLTVTELRDGVVIGLASCPIRDCVNNQGQKAVPAGSSPLELAMLTIGTDKPGLLDVTFDATKIVDSAGHSVPVEIPTRTVTIRVGPSTTETHYPSPPSTWQLATFTGGVPGPFDLTGDRRVTYADAMEVVLAWTQARELGAACGPQLEVSRDINLDGCIDVADVQLVIANSIAAIAPGSSTSTATFIVDSFSRDPDVAVGDGRCATAAGRCSIRASIQEASASSTPVTMLVPAAGGGHSSIQLTPWEFSMMRLALSMLNNVVPLPI